MGAETGIEWTDATWNPTRGCSIVSAGCHNCYAMKTAHRFSAPGAPYAGLTKPSATGPTWSGEVRLVPEALALPLSWRTPRKVFVNSMSDLFHEEVPNEYIAAVFGVMAATPQHTYQVLTKRAERLPEWFKWIAARVGSPSDNCLASAADQIKDNDLWMRALDKMDLGSIHTEPPEWPLPNVWMGVSVEDQRRAEERIPHLLRVPAAVRFLSCEPLLGPLELARWMPRHIDCNGCTPDGALCSGHTVGGGLSWLIIGGESGPGARPFNVSWARSLLKQCREAGVAAFLKQLGANVRTRNDDGLAGGGEGDWNLNDPLEQVRELDTGYQGAPVRVLLGKKGGDMAEWPEDLRVRQWPEVRRG